MVFQAHFFVEVGQGRFGSFGGLPAPVHEEAYPEAAKHGQDPSSVAMAHAAAILIGADIQTLMQAGFNTPVIALQLLPLLGGQAGRFAAGQQILVVRRFAQALPQDDRALRGGGKAGLLRADGFRAKGADFGAVPVLFRPGVRPVRRQWLGRKKKAALVRAAVGPRFGAVPSGWL